MTTAGQIQTIQFLRDRCNTLEEKLRVKEELITQLTAEKKELVDELAGLLTEVKYQDNVIVAQDTVISKLQLAVAQSRKRVRQQEEFVVPQSPILNIPESQET